MALESSALRALVNRIAATGDPRGDDVRGRESNSRGALVIVCRWKIHAPGRSFAGLIAGAHARLGELDVAVTWLEKGVALRSSFVPEDGVLDDLEPLRDHPRYKALLEKLGMPIQP